MSAWFWYACVTLVLRKSGTIYHVITIASDLQEGFSLVLMDVPVFTKQNYA